MFYIASTRFNNETYLENMKYRNKSGIQVIYGTSIRIQEKYDVGSLIFVVEMNNDDNKIEGIGLIRNTLVYDKKHYIYSNSDYNRYVYKGDYWISRKTIIEYDEEIVNICDNVLFKGKSHLKRVSGISILTKKLFTNWDYKLCIDNPNVVAKDEGDDDDDEVFEIYVPFKKRKISTIQNI